MHKGKDQAPCMQLRLVSHGDLFFNDRARNAHPVNLAPHDKKIKRNKRKSKKSKKIKSKKSNQRKSRKENQKKIKEEKRKETERNESCTCTSTCMQILLVEDQLSSNEMCVPSCIYRVVNSTCRVEGPWCNFMRVHTQVYIYMYTHVHVRICSSYTTLNCACALRHHLLPSFVLYFNIKDRV